MVVVILVEKTIKPDPDEKYCSECGAIIKKAAEICPKCGTRVIGLSKTHIQTVQLKNPGLAALASFLWCGAGQVYNGQILKGIILLIAYVISIVLIIIGIGLITTPLLWIYGIYDAYKTAEKINAGDIVIG
ncbi:MAG: zinc ribbon domain-containing protein [Methanosarcinales archaeon]|nr:MAG: zinc ribbon domain-containing protein [Methanosarcinales archaeon]